jgi:hypothetical protein
VVESLVPYEIFPDEETEFVSRIIEQYPGVTREQLVGHLTSNTNTIQLILSRFVNKVDWKWLEHKYSTFKVQ